MTDNILKKHVERTYPPPVRAPEGIARWGAQAYRNRWQIERSFETVKQEFSLEKLRVRTFRRLRNVFSLCVVALQGDREGDPRQLHGTEPYDASASLVKY